MPHKKILIADDDVEILGILKTSLERSGDFEVITAKDGEEAMEKIDCPFPPNLVILDLMMPKRGGLEVLQTIRQNPKIAELPVVISTVRREISSLVPLMNLGATDYLIKPYDVRDLKKLINLFLI